ncbi:MAG: endonuclease III domain-containing protein [Candidatus Omnitrophota bacterium]|nr:endonuclease III domain-containing protein [Candidatus Omnitrophota bacterium]
MLPNSRNLTKIYDRLYGFYGPQHWWPGDTRFEIMVGAILTQNTAWSNVEKAIRNLKEKGALSSPRKIKDMPKRDLARLIRPSGYYNIKSGRLKNLINFLISRYEGDLNRAAKRAGDCLREELLGVNGVGKETCDSILLYAFKRPFFVVDAYTKRIFSRHGFVKEADAYDRVQEIFMNNLPRDHELYNEYHALIVRLGKELCRKRNPKCGVCPLNGIQRKIRTF